MGIGRKSRRLQPARTFRRGRERTEAGFTLVELPIVLGILALLAALATPAVIGYLGRARTETAKIQIAAIAGALDLYALHAGGYPPQEVGLSTLVQPPPDATRWGGPYLKKSEGLIDPWGRPYRYKAPGWKAAFDVFTLGRDNAVGGTGEDQDVTN